MKRIDLEEAIGQKLSGYIYDGDCMVLIFENAYTVVEADEDHYGKPDISYYSNRSLLDINNEKLIEAGVTTKEELEELYKLRRQEERRRGLEQLAMLKERYEQPAAERGPTEGRDR